MMVVVAVAKRVVQTSGRVEGQGRRETDHRALINRVAYRRGRVGGAGLSRSRREVAATSAPETCSSRGAVKLGDFGIAKATLLRETTRAGVRKGTQAYMSPEQLAGRTLTAASDHFSLGVVLFELSRLHRA